jgi:Fe-S cluster biogenesis protein NfuA
MNSLQSCLRPLPFGETSRRTISRRSLVAFAGGSLLVACGDGEAEPTEPAARVPEWLLTDVQPQSAGFGDTYGLEVFRGSPLLVTLLAGGCNTCRGIAYTLETLLQELLAEGQTVNFCAINEYTDPNPQFLTEICSFPVFQDDEATNAWALHGGGRDDVFIYTGDAALVAYYDLPADPNGNPASETGRANLKAALLSGASG